MAVTDVLVVTDSDAVMSLVTFTVGSYWGVLIRRASTCEVAAEKIAERAPQAVVVDADMAQACGMMQTMNTRNIPVIVINDNAAGEGSALRIPPPFRPERLRAALEGITAAI
ncbi:MAG: hypothetical protein CVT67_03235 [Actinobacteria bacterium HGW-Actinobacteria-7]|nr:MAG: hypothetical protein CVT67_03235 [Actinobacteria bacterium HGW-Actinobacteria-7]